jgi:hypothetical protein
MPGGTYVRGEERRVVESQDVLLLHVDSVSHGV